MGRYIWGILAIAMALSGCMAHKREAVSFQREQSAVLEETVPAASKLPWAMEDGGLVAQELVAYEGPYLEDGSMDMVMDVAALLLYNAGERDISSAMVAVNQGSRKLYFFVTWLPAGERVLVLEHGRRAYSREPVTGCESMGVRWENFWEKNILVREEAGGLLVENRRITPVFDVRLRYKAYVPEGNFYLGGITHCCWVGDLAAGESLWLTPEYCGMDVSKIVAVKAKPSLN